MAIKRSDAAGEEEDTRALAREIGRRSVGQLEAGLARILAEASATGRWTLGALVLLNGGGIVLMAAGHPAFAAPLIDSAMSSFIVGAFLAVAAALLSAVSAMVMARHIAEASGHWAQVSVTGEISPDALQAAQKVRRQGVIWTGASIAMGLVSLLLFLAGAIALASGLSAAAAPTETDVPAPAPATAQPQANEAANAMPAPINAAPATNAADPVPAPAQAGPPPAPVVTPARPAERRATPRPAQRRPATTAPTPATTTAPAPATSPPAPTADGATN